MKKLREFSAKFRLTLLNTRRNLGSLFWLTLTVLLVLVAFPSVTMTVGDQQYRFNGLDISDLTGGRLAAEQQFARSLEFSSAQELVFNVEDSAGAALTPAQLQNLATSLSDTLARLQLGGYTVEGRQYADRTEIAMRLPLNELEASNIASVLSLAGTPTFVFQQEQTEEQEAQGLPQFLPANIEFSAVEAVETTYIGLGYGFIVDFKNDQLENLVVSSYSDLTGLDPASRLILSLGGQPFAIQVSGFSLQSPAARVVFATNLFGNDINAATLGRQLIARRDLDYKFSLQSNTTVPATYNIDLDVVKAILISLLLIGFGIIVRRQRGTAAIWIWQVLFVLGFTVGIAKFLLIPTTKFGGINLVALQLPLMLIGMLALVFPVVVAFWQSRGRLGFASLRRVLQNIDDLREVNEFSLAQARRWWRYLWLSALFLITFSTLGIQYLDIYMQYSVLAIAAIWLMFRCVLPAALKFYQLK